MIVYTLSDGREIQPGQAFTFPAGVYAGRRWLERQSPEDLAAHGITVIEVPDPEPEPEPPTVEDLLDVANKYSK